MSSANANAGARRPRLHVVALAHLDTQWRWTVRDTAADFLPDTVAANERLFAEFPHYLLSFEGAHRYRLLGDCHPELLEIVRRRVAEGRWFPAGAAWEAFDANLPSPESLVRQILLGRLEFERAVGRASDDLFLPDCFGFPRSLPDVAAHCGIVGFLTQKLRRGPEMRAAKGIPFPLGRWRGPGGGEVVAALDPGEYGAQTREDLSRSEAWRASLEAQRRAGLPDLLPTLQGLGDKGGAIDPETAGWLERAVGSDGPLEVRVVASERIYRDLTPADRDSLPVHEGDLLLRLHATGCYSSRAQLKRWHREGESLAKASERAAALAAPFRRPADRGAARDALRAAWELLLSHQMHDDLTGTSLPSAYRYSADGVAAALNGFAGELESAIDAIARALDTDTRGEPLAVFNPLSFRRHEPVGVRDLGGFATRPAIFDGEGREVASEWRRGRAGWSGRFLADVAGLSLAIFEARESGDSAGTVSPEARELASSRFAVRIDEHGDLASWIDRISGRELLAAPAGVELLDNRSERFPSWEIRHEDVVREPRSRLGGAARTSFETGPLSRRLRVEQEHERSRWRRDYVVHAGSRDAEAIVELRCRVDWRSRSTLAKATFPLSWDFPEALYDLGCGVAPRPVSTSDLYEVPAQDFAAAPFAAVDGAGVAVLSDAKQGWDHPDARRLRLTLFHTPRTGRRFRYQRRQDFGTHRFRIGIARYDSLAELARLGERFRSPLLAFRAPRGGRGKTRSWTPIGLGDGPVSAMALKPAEREDALVLRLRETSGRAARVAIEIDERLRAGERIDGAERPIDASRTGDETTLAPFEIRARKLELSVEEPGPAHREEPLVILKDRIVSGALGKEARGPGIDGRGAVLPHHLLPGSLPSRGVTFDLAPLRRSGEPGATASRGQSVALPRGFARLSLLVAACGREIEERLAIGAESHAFSIPDSLAALGRFDEPARPLPFPGRGRVREGWLRRAPLALRIPHLGDARGAIDPCRAVNLFQLDFVLDGRETAIRLPDQPRLLIVAATLSTSAIEAAAPLAPLFEGEWEDR